MFAKPAWFRSSSMGLLPAPANVKGWTFYGICVFGILIPTVLLIARGQIFPETAIWLVISLLAFVLEVRGVKRDLREHEARRNMYQINENNSGHDNSGPVETEQYELKIQ